MPVYIYHCDNCSEEFKVNHGMKEDWKVCKFCNSEKIARMPTLFTNLSKTTVREKKVGDLTNDFIENAKEDLRIQKKGLDEER
jgi:putative FmdB family regulatory protein